MRKIIFILLACCVAGCATKAPPPPPSLVVADTTISPPAEPGPMTSAQIAELKRRLGELRAGMSHDKVLEIVDILSLNVRYYTRMNPGEIAYQIKTGHKLSLAFDVGDYDSTLRRAWFDGEIWPKSPPLKLRLTPAAPSPTNIQTQHNEK